MTFAPIADDSPLRGLFRRGLLLDGLPQIGGLLSPTPRIPGVQVTPSATPEMAVPAPQAADLPPQQAPKLSLTDRLKSAFSEVQSSLFPPTDPGLADLMTPDAQHNARKQALFNAGLNLLANGHGVNGGNAPSLGQAIASAAQTGQKTYNDSLGNAVSQHQLATQMQAQKNLLVGRQAIYKDIGLPPTSDPSALRDWIGKAIPRLMTIGDFEAVQRLSPFADKLFAQSGASKKAEIWKDPQGNFHYLTPEQSQGIPEGWTPQASPGTGGVAQLFRGPNEKLAWVKPGEPVPAGFKPERTAVTEFVQGNVENRFDTRRTEAAFKDFRSRLNTLGITKAAPVLNQAILTIEDAKNNPDPNVRKVLFSSAIANFVQAADPKAQIRWQLLNYFKENINASAADRVKLLVKRLKDGTLPDSVLSGMASHLQQVKKLMEKEVESERKSFLKTHSDLDIADRLEEATTFFPDIQDAPAASAPGAAATNTGHLPGNPFTKKP